MTHQEAIDTLASERYLLDEMSDDDRQAFEEHFFSCEACAGELRSAAALMQGAKAGFAGRAARARVVAMPARSTPAPQRNRFRSAVLPWAVAATLAGVAVYQSVWVIPSLRQDAGPIALAAVALRPASRGAEPAVRLDPSARLVSLALDVNEAPQGAELVYDVATAEGRPIASGRAASPTPGAPLLLLLPSASLGASAHYVIAVRDAAAPARLLGEYRFAVSPR